MTRFVAGVGTYQALALAGLIAGCSDLSSHGSDESDALAQTTDMTCGETSEDGGREADAGATADAGGGQRDGGPRRDAGGDAGARGDAAPAAMTDASRDAESVGSEDSGAAPEDGGAPTGVAIPGTWIAQIQTAGNMEVPVIGAVDADIDLIVRIVVSESNGSFEERLEFCSLQTTSTPDVSALAVSYPEAAIATLSASESVPAFTADIGEPFTVPAFTVLGGLDESGESVDADMDGNPGVTLPTNIGGVLSLDAYVGLEIKTSFTASVSAVGEVEGTTEFSVSGTVFGSSNPILLGSGNIDVTPSSSSVPVTARRLDGDVPCSAVLSMFN